MATTCTSFKQIVASAALAIGLCFPLAAPAETLDEMFDALGAAETPGEARRIEARIASEWARSGSPAIDLLWSRGKDALENGDPLAAVEHFTAAIDHAPDFAEAYHGRASAYFILEELGPAIEDLRRTLVLNPRHFGAMRGFAIILEQIGREAQAAEVVDRILTIHPQMEDVAEAKDRLELMLEGTPL